MLAAGSGVRFGTRKQFLELNPGERLVDRAVTTAAALADWVVVVLPDEHVWDGPRVYATTPGGRDRLGSVRAGLQALPDAVDIVLVHDAAHPLATAHTGGAVVAAIVAGADGAVPVLDAVDVIKRVDADGTLRTVGRDGLGAAQVPMAFRRDALETAHGLDNGEAPGESAEDSALLEAHGYRVVAVPGDAANIHVTDESSLDIVRRLAVTLDTDTEHQPESS